MLHQVYNNSLLYMCVLKEDSMQMLIVRMKRVIIILSHCKPLCGQSFSIFAKNIMINPGQLKQKLHTQNTCWKKKGDEIRCDVNKGFLYGLTLATQQKERESPEYSIVSGYIL